MIYYINSYKKLHNKEIFIERNNSRANKNQSFRRIAKRVPFYISFSTRYGRVKINLCFLHEELLQDTLFSEANKTIHFLETNDPSFQPFS